jgi:hypothetical protein
MIESIARLAVKAWVGKVLSATVTGFGFRHSIPPLFSSKLASLLLNQTTTPGWVKMERVCHRI